MSPLDPRSLPRCLGFILVPLLALAAGARGAVGAPQETVGVDWPQWRGAERSGVSPENGWSTVGAPTPAWRKKIGLGHSSFAVVGDRVYTLGHDAEAALDTVYCLDVVSGDTVWSHSYTSAIWDNAHDGGTLTTPTVAQAHVFTSNREGKVFCLDAATGDVRWKRDLSAEKELKPPTWGFSASPLVIADLVIMNVDQVIALDRNTGEDVWASTKRYGIAYSTPAPFEWNGRSLLASLSGDGVAVLDRNDGAEVAFFEWIKTPQIYPMTPVVIGNRIFVSGGYDRGCAMLELTESGLVERWSSRVMRNKMSGCVLYQDHLFGFDESILTCIDLEGNRTWRTRGLGTGSMTIAGGRLVILDGKGQLIIAEANPAEYIELSKASVFDDGTSWSSPVLSHGRIFCRSSKGEMACLDHRLTAAVAPAPITEVASVLPSAAELVNRHVAALGDKDAILRVQSLRMTGVGDSLRNTVKTGAVELDWAAEGAFSWKDESGFQLAHDTTRGWVTGLRSGPALLEGEALAALREAGNVSRILNPGSTYTKMETASRTTFDNRACFAVSAISAAGYARTLYFDEATGFFAGHEGEGIPLWTLGEYREVDGVQLPTRWAFYEPELGEMTSAKFDTVRINPTDEEDRFATPPIIKLLLRTPEEIAADNTRLQTLHAGILGPWRAPDAPADEEDDRLEVVAGFLQLTAGPRPPIKLTEPDATGRMAMIGQEYVELLPVKNEAGVVTGIEVQVGGALEVTLTRPNK